MQTTQLKTELRIYFAKSEATAVKVVGRLQSAGFDAEVSEQKSDGKRSIIIHSTLSRSANALDIFREIVEPM